MCTYEEFSTDFAKFFLRHGKNWRLEESPMVNDSYMKIYHFPDGATWYEQLRPVYETAEIIVKGVKSKVLVKLCQVEYWNSDCPSKFYYERY